MTTVDKILLGFGVGVCIYHYFILRHFRRAEFFRGYLQGRLHDEDLSIEETAVAIERAYKEENAEVSSE